MRRARIDFVAPPMSGHLHPILGIGRRLARDHDVRVYSTAGVQSEISAAGLGGRVVLAGADDAISAIVNPPYAVKNKPWRLHKQFAANLDLLARLKGELLEKWHDERPDLVIADFTVPVAGSAAMELGISWWTVTPSGVAIETPDGPPGYLGGWQPRVGPIGRARDAVGRAVVRSFKRVVYQLHAERLRGLGFPALYRDDGYEAIYSPDRVLAVSAQVLEFPRSFPRTVEFVGPVLYSPPVDAPEPPFVAGKRHVLITLGTHLGWQREAVATAVLETARRLPEFEFHLSDGDWRSARRDSIGNFHRIGFISYTDHLARYDLVVHHAGAGVLAHTLAAGTVAVIMPGDFDQFDYAARLVAAGVAVRARKLSELPAAITRAASDRSMKAACLRMRSLLMPGAAEERVAQLVARHFAEAPAEVLVEK